ncbi:MAG TPA: UDP-N-acetylmuramate:L-alanyl-gamma-D-glutamyl-meso-diaminopimelate ligase [Candidatus Acidoferrales bacterium]|nr:UDP-N-acetylmuramate:L-alanyl-gamma-D-glutamyl-meso-diaminopimelate ligase [Candidatus Acidoferrales bacterium]
MCRIAPPCRAWARNQRRFHIAKPTTNTAEHIHLLGIAGSAMAPVAGMLKERGFRVTGSDVNVYPPASTLLDSLAIPWNEGFREENLEPAPDLAVIGNANSRGNPEVEYILDRKIPYCSMPQLLEQYFIPGHTSIVIAGTHGKTTTTAMLAWIFHVAGRRPDFLIGGVSPNFGDRSYGLEGGEEFIVEGDEYDSAFFDKGPKFLHYHPDELILTSLEYDHADIYPDLASIALQFQRLVNLVPRRGRIVFWGESPELREAVAKAFCPVETFGLTPDCDWYAGDILWHDSATEFRVSHRGSEIARVRTPVAGRHNVLDALAAIALAYGRGIEREAIERAFATFQSVRRRMEVKGEANGILVVEDFAHHPTAIRLTLEAARTRWPGRKIWAAIEPRSNTMRRKVFQDALPEALAAADGVVIGPVNRPQLLSEEERLSPDAIAESLCRSGRSAKAFGSASDIADYLAAQAKPGDLVIVMSNGSFDGLCGKLLAKWKPLAGALS